MSPIAAQTTNVSAPGRDGDVEQERRGAVGERLSPRPRRLGLADQPLDPRERGLLADGLDRDPDGVVGGDRASDDAVAGPATTGAGLAGDHRLVERRRRLR